MAVSNSLAWDGDTHVVRLTFLNRGRHDLDLLNEIVALSPNPPQLDQIGFAIRLPADEIEGLPVPLINVAP